MGGIRAMCNHAEQHVAAKMLLLDAPVLAEYSMRATRPISKSPVLSQIIAVPYSLGRQSILLLSRLVVGFICFLAGIAPVLPCVLLTTSSQPAYPEQGDGNTAALLAINRSASSQSSG